MSNPTLPAPATTELEVVEHSVAVSAPAATVYAALADVAQWPQVFPPTVHAERIAGDDRSERIRIVATAADSVESWESERTLDSERRSILFRQTRFQPPIAFMEGTWRVVVDDDGGSTVLLGHRYAATEPERLPWLREVVDHNSRAELDALRLALAERPGDGMTDLRLVDFADSVTIAAPPQDVFAFIDEAERWPERLPHVVDVAFTRLADGVQDLAMTTRSPDGTSHRTRSYRVVLPGGAIAYKQFTLPPLMASHLGRWTFEEQSGHTVATSAHTVLIDTERIAESLGPDADLQVARESVQAALSANSLATLRLAKAYAEGRRDSR